MTRIAMIVVLLFVSIGTVRAACPDAAMVAATRAIADQQCPCASQANHKRYIQCVAGVAKAAAKSGTLPKQCRASVVACAKKSTCGRPGFVTCCRTTMHGSTKCSVKPSEANCTVPKGGSACVGALPSCCDSCTAGSCTGVTTTTTTPSPTTTTPRPTTTTTMAGARTHTVMVGPGGSLVFSPANLIIQVGDTVRWVWGSPGHSVVSGTGGNADNRFCSPSNTGCDNPPLSNSGVTYEHTFTQAGNFPYYCSVHFGLGMNGSIKVQ
jgi:plastocyanin